MKEKTRDIEFLGDAFLEKKIYNIFTLGWVIFRLNQTEFLSTL